MPFRSYRNSFIPLVLLAIALMMAAMWSPTEAASSKKLSVIRVCKVKGHCIFAELASTRETLMRGLMFRDKLPDDCGMLFIFGRPDFWKFWMKDTKMPLDIVWMDKSKRIVFIVTEAQPCARQPCREYIPDEKALYVLELAAGKAKKWSLKIGDRLNFEIPKEILETVR